MLQQEWRIQLLGGLRAVSGARVVDRFRTEKTGALLAYLALHIGRPIPRDDLIDLLWPGSDIDRGRMSLRTALSSLRRQLEPPGTPAGAVISADHATLKLNASGVTTDVSDFNSAVESAASSVTEDERAGLLSEAARLYNGPLLAGYYDDWIIPARERVAATHLGALRHLTRHHVSNRELPVALGFAQEAVRAAPESEDVQRDLIRLYLALGRNDAAARQMDALLDMLRTEVGREPSAATRQIQEEVRRRGASAVGSGQPVQHGAAPAASKAFATAGAQDVRRNRIPPRFTKFFGREEELGLIGEMVCCREDGNGGGSSRLVTITGPGGTGKTRLALEASAGAAGRPGADVYFVPLEDVADSRLVCPKIAEIMGIVPNPTVPALDQIKSALVDMPALLVLDNFEQIADTASGVVLSLLSRLPRLTCLVTSRRRLELPGEREIPLSPLPIPAGEANLGALAGIPSVQLFVDRAQAARPDFQLTKGNSEAVSALCARLEGIPLALELAAARSKVLAPAQMLHNLEERFALLASNRSDKSSRHRSLWAAIDWSYGLLPEDVRSFFAATSIFRGGWTWGAAEEICGEPRTLEYLNQLRAHSLIVAEEAGEEMRFRLLESIRKFAEEHLSDGESSRLTEAHSRYYLKLAEDAEAQLTGQDQAVWMLRIQTEHDNVRAVLDRCLANGIVETAARIGAAIWRFWWVRGYADEGRRWLNRAIQDGREKLAPSLLARALHGAGTLAWACSDCESAETLHLEALDLRQKLGDLDGAARSLGSLGNARRELRDIAGARVYYQQSLELFRQVGDTRNVATSLLNLGTVVEDSCDLGDAREYYRQSLELYRELGDRYSVALALANIGSVDITLGDYPSAFAAIRESAEIRREIGATAYLAATLSFFAQLYIAAGNPELAVRLLGASAAQMDSMTASIPMSSFVDIRQELFKKAEAAIPKARFAELLSEGRALTFDEAYEAAISGYSSSIPV